MISFPTITLPGFDFEPIFMGNLIEYEGPLVSLFSDAINPDQFYLYKMADQDERANRWLVIPVKRQSILDFFQYKTTFLDLLTSGNQVYFQDFGKNLEPLLFGTCATRDLPDGYLPTEKAPYDPQDFTPFAATCATLLQKPATTNQEITPTIKRLKKLSQIKTSYIPERLVNSGKRILRSYPLAHFNHYGNLDSTRIRLAANGSSSRKVLNYSNS